jgi:hypothetical protein
MDIIAEELENLTVESNNMSAPPGQLTTDISTHLLGIGSQFK